MYKGQKILDFHFFSFLLNTFNSDKCTEKIFCSPVKLTTIKCHHNPLGAAEVILFGKIIQSWSKTLKDHILPLAS